MDPTELDQDEIRLTVPADPTFARVARVAGGALAARLGFGYDEIEEVRLAVGEAWAMLLGVGRVHGEVQLTFRVGQRALSLELAVPEGAPGRRPGADEAAVTDPAAVLAQLVDTVEVDPGRRWVRFEKHQRAGP